MHGTAGFSREKETASLARVEPCQPTSEEGRR
jgi:hypothetical protein